MRRAEEGKKLLDKYQDLINADIEKMGTHQAQETLLNLCTHLATMVLLPYFKHEDVSQERYNEVEKNFMDRLKRNIGFVIEYNTKEK